MVLPSGWYVRISPAGLRVSCPRALARLLGIPGHHLAVDALHEAQRREQVGREEGRRPADLVTERAAGPSGPRVGRTPFRCPKRARDASRAFLRDNAARPAHPRPDRRPPLSGKQPTPTTTRKERRAAERQDRFEKERDERRNRDGAGGSGGSSFINTRTMTIAGIAVGVLIVVVVAAGQLGGRASGKLSDPGFAYPAALLDGSNAGTVGAPVVMQVYEDFQCPVCGKYSLDVEPSLVNKYVAAGQLRIEHNDIAILGSGDANDESMITAKGAYCANEQGKYWPYAHWIYSNQIGENQGDFNTERVTQIAVAAGIEEQAFSSCLAGEAALTHVGETTSKALGLGINSTPTMYIGGQQIVGLKSVAELSALIDAELAKASSAPAASPSASTTP
jgi:protein-disulfide isomerase